MSPTHYHLLVNHIPIILLPFVMLILIWGWLKDNQQIRKIAYFGYIVIAIFTFASIQTGEKAEDVTEKVIPQDKQYIRTHEEEAEHFSYYIYGIALTVLLTYFLDLKQFKDVKYFYMIIVIITLISIYLSIKVGNTGGQIRHPEIRDTTKISKFILEENK